MIPNEIYFSENFSIAKLCALLIFIPFFLHLNFVKQSTFNINRVHSNSTRCLCKDQTLGIASAALQSLPWLFILSLILSLISYLLALISYNSSLIIHNS